MKKKRIVITEKLPQELPHFVVHGDFLHFHFEEPGSSAYATTTPLSLSVMPMLWQLCLMTIFSHKLNNLSNDMGEEIWLRRTYEFAKDIIKCCDETYFIPNDLNIEKLALLFKEKANSNTSIYHIPGITKESIETGQLSNKATEQLGYLIAGMTGKLQEVSSDNKPQSIGNCIQSRYKNTSRNFYVCITGLRDFAVTASASNALAAELIKMVILYFMPIRKEGIDIEIERSFDIGKIGVNPDEMLMLAMNNMSIEHFVY